MPAQNRVGCHECRDLCQQSTSETLADDGETTPLVVVKANASPTGGLLSYYYRAAA